MRTSATFKECHTHVTVGSMVPLPNSLLSPFKGPLFEFMSEFSGKVIAAGGGWVILRILYLRQVYVWVWPDSSLNLGYFFLNTIDFLVTGGYHAFVSIYISAILLPSVWEHDSFFLL